MSDEKRDELADFLESFHFISADVSDTFGYACADSERIYLDGDDDPETDITNQRMLVNIWRRFGHTGVIAYVAKMRGKNPVKELQTAEMLEAMQFLADWEYEPD